MVTSSIEGNDNDIEEISSVTDLLKSSPAYTTDLGAAYHGDSRDLLQELPSNSIDLIVTSPPFALQHKKEYGNEDQESYNDWFMQFIPEVQRVLQPHGSLIIEIGGAFEKGFPRRSIYQWKLITRIVEEEDLEFAQDWYWYNPSKLPSPIEWVNVRKLRGVDAVTQIWWLAKEINKQPAYTDDLQEKVEMIRSLRVELAEELNNKEMYNLVETILYASGDLPSSESEINQSEFLNQTTFKDYDQTENVEITIERIKSLLADTRIQQKEEWEKEYDLSDDDVRMILNLNQSGADEGLESTIADLLTDNLSAYTVLSLFDLIIRTNKAPRVYGKKVLADLKDGKEINPPYPKPEVNNQRNNCVLKGYSEDQEELIETGNYNEGKRSSGHNIGTDSFANDNQGAIPKNFIEASNTASNTHYQRLCRQFGLERHPARFPEEIPKKFVNLLTPDPPYDEWERGDVGKPGVLDRPIVLDIFAGSNWTGKVSEEAGRHWLSFEQNEKYIRTSEIRFLSEEELANRLENDGNHLQQYQE